MFVNEYFDNLECYCFKKYDIPDFISIIVDVIDGVIQIKVQVVKSDKEQFLFI